MIKRNCIKVLIGVVAATSIASCGDSGDHDATPTATLQTTPPTESSVSPTTEPASGPASTATTTAQIYAGTPPPTIVFDDSAARQFWTPVPAGATPEQWQPEYLTREELTRYEPLVDPDPASWDIPPEGITPDYAKRVFSYIQTLQTAIVRAGVVIGVQEARVRNSVHAPYTGMLADDFVNRLDETYRSRNNTWGALTDIEVHEVTSSIGDQPPCMFVHVSYQLVAESDESPSDVWQAFVRDSYPNWLNPTGWRQITTTPADTDDLDRYSCAAVGDAL